MAAYIVYRDAVPFTLVGPTQLSVRDSLASPNTTHAYTVVAVDSSTNLSAPSAPAVVTTPAPPSVFNLPATIDSYVNEANPTRNYGRSTRLRADGSPTVVSYLQFNVAGLTGAPTSATLRIYAETGSPFGLQAFAVADTAWTELAITFANAPPVGSLLDSSAGFGAGAYIDIDVTSYITGNGIVSIAVSTPGATAIRLSSRTAINPPQLVLQG